jgi:hypothetical protein
MKTNAKPQPIQSKNRSFSELRRISLALIFAIVMTFLALSGKAANVLVNPSFNSAPLFAPGSWTQHSSQTWSSGSASSADPTPAADKLIHSGANGLWMQGVYSGAQDQYVSQTFATIPGNTYSADAWFSAYTYCSSHIGGDDGSDPTNAFTYPIGNPTGGGSGLYGADGSGNEDGWVEVKFYNSGNVVIADYKSMIVDPAYLGTAATTTLPLVTNALGNIYLAWEDFAVTNQYDPSTLTPNSDPALNIAGITNTLGSGQNITAPAGAVRVEFGIHLFQALYAPGAPFWDDCTLNLVGGPSASVIGSLSPDGTKFFNAASTNLTFNVLSAAAGAAPLPTNPTNNIHVVVNGHDKSGSLQFSGNSTNWNVTLPGFTTNQIYTVGITVTNSSNLASSTSVTFDTFGTNNFIVSSEDYDYNGGQFIQNPTPTSTNNPNSYFGRAGTLGTDDLTYGGTGTLPVGSAQLVRADGNVAFQRATDFQLPIYQAANDLNVYDVNLSYNNGGNWENYTRVYPAGNYTVYGRISGGGGAGLESLNLLTSGYGTATQTTTNLGAFILSNGTDWSHYMWIPLTDSYGNFIIVNLPGGQQTLQLLSGGGENVVFFMFVPAGTGFPPVINNLSPNNVNPPVNTNIFLNVTNITFSVSSAFSTIASNNIHALVNGVDISPLATFSGNNTNWSVSVPALQNQLLTLVINATDANGLSNSVTETFDTFSQNNFMIEAEDFDFNGGQFIDNPTPTYPITAEADSYYNGGVDGTNASVFGVDFTSTFDGGEPHNYRNDNIGTENTADFVRDKFIANGSLDIDIGYWNGGQWLNYSRTFPTNNYNVYGRLAGGNGPFNNTTMKLVTAGVGTPTQTTQLLGSFADANAAGWQTWHWVPMLDTNGMLAKVSLGGVKTLQVTSGNNLNANYYMFVPAISQSVMTASISGSSVLLKFPTQTGHSYTVLYKNSLTGGSWQPLSTPVNGDGTIKTVTDTVGSQRFYKLLIE